MYSIYKVFVWCFTFVTVMLTPYSTIMKVQMSYYHLLSCVIGSSCVLAWLTHITQIQAHRSMVNMYISICGFEVTRHTYVTFVPSSVIWEVCVIASTGLAQSLCVCLALFSPYLHALIFIWSTERWQTPQRPGWAQAILLSLFPPHLSHSLLTPHAPGLQWWKQMLFIH